MTTLENLDNFRNMNAGQLTVIKGGAALIDASNKKDVDSTSGDSWKRDK